MAEQRALVVTQQCKHDDESHISTLNSTCFSIGSADNPANHVAGFSKPRRTFLLLIPHPLDGRRRPRAGCGTNKQSLCNRCPSLREPLIPTGATGRATAQIQSAAPCC